MTASQAALDLVQAAAIAADAKQARNVVALDVSELSPFTDAFVIASGQNERQVGAISDAIEDALLELGVKAIRREGKSQGRWVLLDFGNIVTHIMHEEDRMYYALERLWSEAPVIPVTLPEVSDEQERGTAR